MAKVRAFELPGFDAWFNSDDHLPPHFHVEKTGEWELRVRFLRNREEMFEVVWPKNPTKRRSKPSKADLRVLADATEACRADLLQQWEKDVAVKSPGPER